MLVTLGQPTGPDGSVFSVVPSTPVTVNPGEQEDEHMLASIPSFSLVSSFFSCSLPSASAFPCVCHIFHFSPNAHLSDLQPSTLFAPAHPPSALPAGLILISSSSFTYSPRCPPACVAAAQGRAWACRCASARATASRTSRPSRCGSTTRRGAPRTSRSRWPAQGSTRASRSTCASASCHRCVRAGARAAGLGLGFLEGWASWRVLEGRASWRVLDRLGGV